MYLLGTKTRPTQIHCCCVDNIDVVTLIVIRQIPKSQVHALHPYRCLQVIRPENSDHWTLQIKFPQMRDTGIYECQVNTEPKMSMIFRLSVIGEYTHFLEFSLFGRVSLSLFFKRTDDDITFRPSSLVWRSAIPMRQKAKPRFTAHGICTWKRAAWWHCRAKWIRDRTNWARYIGIEVSLPVDDDQSGRTEGLMGLMD